MSGSRCAFVPAQRHIDISQCTGYSFVVFMSMLLHLSHLSLRRIDFCQQILHRLIDDRQKVAVGEHDDTIFINKHIGALRHTEKTEGVIGFCNAFFGVTQKGEGKFVAFSKAFVGGLTVGADAEHHNAAFGELQNIVPVIAQLGGADRGIVTGVEDDEYFFSGKV